MKYLVTGGAGFIGSHIVEALLNRGNEVICIDNLSSGSCSNIKLFESNSNYTFYKENILEPRATQDIVKEKPDCIFHLAAIPNVAKSIDYPNETFETNVIGTKNILDAARINKTPVVFSSSSSVYGGTSILPTPESAPLNPQSPYAMHKQMGEMLCKQYALYFGVKSICLRYFNVTGPRQQANSAYGAVIPAFIEAHLNNKTYFVEGTGEQYRDFCYIDNVVQANLLAAKKIDYFEGECFNIGNGYTCSINKLADKIAMLTDKKTKRVNTSSRPGDVFGSQADITKAKKLLGYNPKFLLEDGLKTTIEWWRKQK